MKKTKLELILKFLAVLLIFLVLGCGKTNTVVKDFTTNAAPESISKTGADALAPLTASAIGQGAFSLWGTCSTNPYLISGSNGICVPAGGSGCGSSYLGAQQSTGQNATGLQFYGCFKGGSNAPDGSNEMAVFLCNNVTSWDGDEMGFIKTLNDNTLKVYVQGNGNYNYHAISTADNGYHTFKCQVESGDHSKVDFYVDGSYVWTLQNPGVNYWSDWYYFVGTTHRTSDGWSSTGQQVEMYDMTTF